MSNQSTCFSWRQAVSVSELCADAKHLLLTMSLFMNEEGAGCFPSITTLEERCSRSRPWVVKYLKLVKEDGWLTIEQHGYRGRKWKRNEYVARWPDRDIADAFFDPEDGLNPDDVSEENEQQGGKRGLPPQGDRGGKSQKRGGKRRLHKVVNHVNSNSPINNPLTSPARANAQDGADAPEREDLKNGIEGEKPETSQMSLKQAECDPRFSRAFKNYPAFDADPKAPMWKAWTEIADADRELITPERVQAYVTVMKALKRDYFPKVSKVLGERMLFGEQIEKRLSAGMGAGHRLPVYGPDWWAYRRDLIAKGKDGKWVPTKSQQKLLDSGWDAAKFELDRLRAEYRAVHNLDEQARQMQGPTVAELPERGKILKLKVGSDEWDRFCDLHRENGWPEPDVRKGVEFCDIAIGSITDELN